MSSFRKLFESTLSEKDIPVLDGESARKYAEAGYFIRFSRRTETPTTVEKEIHKYKHGMMNTSTPVGFYAWDMSNQLRRLQFIELGETGRSPSQPFPVGNDRTYIHVLERGRGMFLEFDQDRKYPEKFLDKILGHWVDFYVKQDWGTGNNGDTVVNLPMLKPIKDILIRSVRTWNFGLVKSFESFAYGIIEGVGTPTNSNLKMYDLSKDDLDMIMKFGAMKFVRIVKTFINFNTPSIASYAENGFTPAELYKAVMALSVVGDATASLQRFDSTYILKELGFAGVIEGNSKHNDVMFTEGERGQAVFFDQSAFKTVAIFKNPVGYD